MRWGQERRWRTPYKGAGRSGAELGRGEARLRKGDENREDRTREDRTQAGPQGLRLQSVTVWLQNPG